MFYDLNMLFLKKYVKIYGNLYEKDDIFLKNKTMGIRFKKIRYPSVLIKYPSKKIIKSSSINVNFLKFKIKNTYFRSYNKN